VVCGKWHIVENERVRGDAYRREPLGRADSMSRVLILDCNPAVGVLRSAEAGIADMNSGISIRSDDITSCLSRASSLRSDFRSRCCLLATVAAPLACHGALNTAIMLGHSSDVADEICCMLTGATVAEAAWKAMLSAVLRSSQEW
jgi:hypothetical protein